MTGERRGHLKEVNLLKVVVGAGRDKRIELVQLLQQILDTPPPEDLRKTLHCATGHRSFLRKSDSYFFFFCLVIFAEALFKILLPLRRGDHLTTSLRGRREKKHVMRNTISRC